MKKPLVSVVIAVYNGEDFVADAVKSILSDEMSSLELIVVDDGSTDGSAKVISEIRDNRLVLLKNDGNKGVSFSFNKAIKESSGKYIAFLGADDISLPHRLKTQYEFMESHTDIDICGSWAEVFGDLSAIMSPPVNDAEIRTQVLFHCPMAHPTVMLRRSLLMNEGLFFDENLSCAVDYDLWARAVGVAKFHNIPEMLVRYRTHSKQIGSAKKKEQYENAHNIVKRILASADIFPSSRYQLIHAAFSSGATNPQDLCEFTEVANWATILTKNKILKRNHPLIKEYIRDKVDYFICYIPPLQCWIPRPRSVLRRILHNRMG
jgi:glycosyltransferase involved in cell wall biosynthesis